MVVSEFMVKIIDYGEAYSPNITPKYLEKGKQKFRYNPGKTLPFAPPEVFSRSNNLTSKQDIFSLGIIIFKLFFGYYPINCSDSVFEKIYSKGTFMERMFFAPEQIEDVGNIELLSVICLLVFRMLDNKEELRPNPTWTHILMKKLLASQKN